jgi:hypothetical protein
MRSSLAGVRLPDLFPYVGVVLTVRQLERVACAMELSSSPWVRSPLNCFRPGIIVSRKAQALMGLSVSTSRLERIPRDMKTPGAWTRHSRDNAG